MFFSLKPRLFTFSSSGPYDWPSIGGAFCGLQFVPPLLARPYPLILFTIFSSFRRYLALLSVFSP